MSANEAETEVLIGMLSSRELEVLQLISDGLSNREIANQLYLSLDTIKWHNKQIFGKLGVKNRTLAARKARELSLQEILPGPKKKGEGMGAGNLPAQINVFLGRKKEILEVKEMLKNSRLVVLTGAGGSGKTRLALKVAEELQYSYSDGVWLVDLAHINDAALVLQTIANVLGLSKRPNTTLINIVKKDLTRKHLLFLVDNLEHLLDSMHVLSELLESAPGLTILATSRERPNLYGEQDFPVPPLNLPGPGKRWSQIELKENEAIALFVERARAVKPDLQLDEQAFQQLAHICVSLDGLPLAIELCAPMVKMLPLPEIADRIESNLGFLPKGPRDSPARQQTLRQTLQWSLDLLNTDEKRLLERMAMFRGGGTMNAVKAVCANGISGNIESLIMALIDKNLILAQELKDGEIHFGMLETVRKFNLERLRQHNQFEFYSKSHAAYYFALASQAEKGLVGVEQEKWLAILDTDLENIRAALAWYLSLDDIPESSLRFSAALEHFWVIRGYLEEGRKCLSTALARHGAYERSESRAKALHAEGHLAYIQGDYPLVREKLEESLSIYRELGPAGRLGAATVEITLGDMYTEIGEYLAAAALMQEALEIMRVLHDQNGISRALWQLGACAVRIGDFSQATEYFEEALPLLRQTGNKYSTPIAISGLAEIAIREGYLDRARALEEESIAMRREVGDPWGIAVSLGNLAWISLIQGNARHAENDLWESLSLRGEIGDRGGIAWCLEKLAEIALMRGQLENSPISEQTFQRAARLLGSAAAIRAQVDSKINVIDQPAYDRHTKSLRELLGDDTYQQVWRAGFSMSVEQATAFGLSNSPVP